MIQDATDQQIKAILTHSPLAGKTVLEIGCGKGRVTRDLARHATRVIASDPDAAAIEVARQQVPAENVDFIHAADGVPDLPEQSVDLVIYTLSLHHVPVTAMQTSLLQSGRCLKQDGAILVMEPGDAGSFNRAKVRFGIGNGDENPLKAAAVQAMTTLPGWAMSAPYHFMTEFLFTDENDFFTHKLHHFAELSKQQQQQIRNFLQRHRTERGIILSAERRLNRLDTVAEK